MAKRVFIRLTRHKISGRASEKCSTIFREVAEDFTMDRYDHARSGLLDRRSLAVDELPLTALPNKNTGPEPLLIYRSIFVLSFGGGAIGHDSRVPEDADFDLIRDQRVEIHAPALAILQILRPVLDVPVRTKMAVILVQDPLKESKVRLDDSRIEVLDELRQHALVAGLVADDRAAGREHENCDPEKLLHHPTPIH
jgi:hypothetical protein